MNLFNYFNNISIGKMFYCTICGTVKFVELRINPNRIVCVVVETGNIIKFDEFGRLVSTKYNGSGECVLFPSKDNRNWNICIEDLPVDSLVAVHVCNINRHTWYIGKYKGNGIACKINEENFIGDVMEIYPLDDIVLNGFDLITSKKKINYTIKRKTNV